MDLREDGSPNVESLQFDFDTIRVATDGFSDENQLGRGGFGAVYKVTPIQALTYELEDPISCN